MGGNDGAGGRLHLLAHYTTGRGKTKKKREEMFRWGIGGYSVVSNNTVLRCGVGQYTVV